MIKMVAVITTVSLAFLIFSAMQLLESDKHFHKLSYIGTGIIFMLVYLIWLSAAEAVDFVSVIVVLPVIYLIVNAVLQMVYPFISSKSRN